MTHVSDVRKKPVPHTLCYTRASAFPSALQCDGRSVSSLSWAVHPIVRLFGTNQKSKKKKWNLQPERKTPTGFKKDVKGCGTSGCITN